MALRIYNLDPITITVGGTAYPLAPSNPAIYVASITLQAAYTNVGRICIGGPGLTTDHGIQIAPGEAAVIEYPQTGRYTDEFLLNEIYVTSSSAGDVVRPIYMKKA